MHDSCTRVRRTRSASSGLAFMARSAILAASLGLGVAAPVAADPGADPATEHAFPERDADTVLRCETRREFREIDRLHFVVEPVARCAIEPRRVQDLGEMPGIKTRLPARVATRLPARIGRARSIQQGAEPTEVGPDRAVRWSPDRSRLFNRQADVQAERNRRALNGRIVRR